MLRAAVLLSAIAALQLDRPAARVGRRAWASRCGAGVLVALPLAPPLARPARAAFNPLGLKGTLWETGKLYERADPTRARAAAAVRADLRAALGALRALRARALAGDYGALRAAWRGGELSGAALRERARELCDALANAVGDVDELEGARACARARLRLRARLDALDAALDAATNSPEASVGAALFGLVSPFVALGEADTALRARARGDAGAAVIGALEAAIVELEAFVGAPDAANAADPADAAAAPEAAAPEAAGARAARAAPTAAAAGAIGGAGPPPDAPAAAAVS